MCVSMFPAELFATMLFAGEKNHPEYGLIRTLGYQNTAKNLNSNGPNAMLLHFPSAEPMGSRNILDTSKVPNIMKDMVTAVQPRTRSMAFVAKSMSLGFEIFDHDIYTIVMARNALEIMNALPLVRADRRPRPNEALFAYYANKLRGLYSVALCCFNNRDAESANPMFWWYRPRFPHVLEAPALDAHDGGIPNEQGLVDVDTWLMFGSDNIPVGNTVEYSDSIPDSLYHFLPTRVVGKFFGGKMSNGDFSMPVAALRNGNLNAIQRTLPGQLN